MIRAAVLGVSLVSVLCVSPPALAQPSEPPPPPPPPVTRAVVTPPPEAATPATAPPPAAAPAQVQAAQAQAPQRKPWKEWLDRQPPLLSEELATERIWYGWQTLLIDGIALTTVALTAVEEEDEFIWFGLGLLLIGSPIVHFAHVNVPSGVTSLAIRAASAGLIALGAVIATDNDFDSGSDDSETMGTAIAIVGLLGVATAVAMDASYLGWEEKPKAARRALLTPWIDPGRGRFGLGYATAF